MSTLATSMELETHLQRPIASEVAALALAGASGVVRDYCGWGITREATTFLLDADSSLVLDLPTLHLMAVDEIRVDGIAIADTVSPQPRWVSRGQIFWPWPVGAKVEVDVVHGYSMVPDLVRLITLTVAARIVTNPDDVKQASTSSVSRTYDTSLSTLELRLLDSYRL